MHSYKRHPDSFNINYCLHIQTTNQCRYIWNGFLQSEFSTLKTMTWWIICHPNYCLYILLKFSFLVCSTHFYVKKPKNSHSYSLCSLESSPYLTGACQNFLLCCIEWEHFLKCKYLWQHWLPSLNPKTKNIFLQDLNLTENPRNYRKFGTFTRTNKSVSIGCGDFSGKGSIFYSIKNKTIGIHLTLSTPAYGSSPKLSKLHELFSKPLNTHISLRHLELPKWQIIQHAPLVPPLQ